MTSKVTVDWGSDRFLRTPVGTGSPRPGPGTARPPIPETASPWGLSLDSRTGSRVGSHPCFLYFNTPCATLPRGPCAVLTWTPIHPSEVQMKMMHQPIEHCYWVAPGRLLAGEYPRNIDEDSSRLKITALILSGVTAFIDLTEDTEGLLPYSDFLETVSHQRFPIRDLSIPKPKALAVAILDAIDHHIGRGGMVYLHCWGGVGRTGVMVGCWLARHGFPGEAALARLNELWQQCPKSARRVSPETPEQRHYILTWEEARRPA